MVSLIGVLAEAHRDALASMASADAPLADVLEEAETLADGGAALIVATGLDAPGDGFDAVVERIARRRDLTFLLIVDPFERAPPEGAYPYTTADGDAGWLRIGSAETFDEVDERIARLARLGARAATLGSELGAEAMAGVLERIHG